MTVSFDAWKAGHVAPSRHEVPVVVPKTSVKLEPVSARLKGELVHPSRTGALVGLRFAPDGKRFVAGDYPGGLVVLWEVATGKQLQAIDAGHGYRGALNYFSLTPDWRTLFYTPKGKRKYERVEKGGKTMYRWEFDGAVRTWDLEAGRPGRSYQQQPPRGIPLMQLSRDGSHFVTLEEVPGVYERAAPRVTTLWGVADGRPRQLPGQFASLMEFSPDGRTLAAATERGAYATSLKLIDADTATDQWSVPVTDKHAWLFPRAFSPDGRVLVGNYYVYARANKWDEYQFWLKWWDAATGREIASFPADKNDSFGTSCFAPDGRTLAATGITAKTCRLFLYDVPKKALARTVVLGEKRAGERLITGAPAFSPDGRLVAVGTHAIPEKLYSEPDPRDLPQPRIHLIDVATGTLRETLVAPPCFGRDACFSPDGKTLATSGHGRVLLWDLTGLPGSAAQARQR